jgi:hypothetical protein
MAQIRTNSSGISSTPIRSKDSKNNMKTQTRERERERERESDRLEIGDLIVRQTGRPPLSERCSSYSLCKLRKKKKREKTHPHLKTMIYSYYQKTICYACVCVRVLHCHYTCQLFSHLSTRLIYTSRTPTTNTSN